MHFSHVLFMDCFPPSRLKFLYLKKHKNFLFILSSSIKLLEKSPYIFILTFVANDLAIWSGVWTEKHWSLALLCLISPLHSTTFRKVTHDGLSHNNFSFYPSWHLCIIWLCWLSFFKLFSPLASWRLLPLWLLVLSLFFCVLLILKKGRGAAQSYLFLHLNDSAYCGVKDRWKLAHLAYW